MRIDPARRRLVLGTGATLALAGCGTGPSVIAPAGVGPPRPPVDRLTIDMHSHAGRVTVSRDPALGDRRPFAPVAEPMREGGLQVVCLAIVTDTLVTRVSVDRRRIEAWREPCPGELYALSQTEFARLERLIEVEGLNVIATAADLDAAPRRGPSAIVASEGADFLEGQVERVDEAWRAHRLRHLQLVHYRVNELGDIQTAPPVRGGLTDFGAEVVRRCNRLGIVVDLAHATFDVVRRAAVVSATPLVISHTALADHPGPLSRQVGAAHARAIAATGGVVGVWPSAGSFRDLPAMARGARELADLIGVEHVGLGSDLLGFIRPPVLTSYRQLPAYADALIGQGFTPDQVAMVLGENYARVLRAVLSAGGGAR